MNLFNSKFDVIQFAIVCLLCASGLAKVAAQETQAGDVRVVHWPGVAVYEKSTAKDPLFFLPAGAKIVAQERSHSWVKIRHGEKLGWVNRHFLESWPVDEPSHQSPPPEPTLHVGADSPDDKSPTLDQSGMREERLPVVNAPDELKRSLMFLASQVDSSHNKANSTWPEGAFSQILLKGSHPTWVPQVIAPSKLRIGKDNLKLWVKSPKSGYLYVWSEPEDGELVLLFPNQRDFDNRIHALEVMHLPRKSWPIKSTGPAGKVRLLVIVSEIPRILPPPLGLLKELNDESVLAESATQDQTASDRLVRHLFWTTSDVSLNANSALVHFLKPNIEKEDCAPKLAQCSLVYGVKELTLMKVD